MPLTDLLGPFVAACSSEQTTSCMAPSPSKDGQQRARLDPPPAESPVWLPSLAQTRGAGGHSPSKTLPKTKNLPMANTLKQHGGDPASLFSMSTLPHLDALELPGMRKKKVRAVLEPGRLSVPHQQCL
jgi:hypothetical protein